jgi:predicted TIM-barrel fold metal-dependent hydrolase
MARIPIPKEMDRKEFFHTGLLLGAAGLTAGSCNPLKKSTVQGPDFISDIPIYCGHEHWGSLFNIGFEESGYVADLKPGALPTRRTTLMDLLVDPYMGGTLAGNGIHPPVNGEGSISQLPRLLDDLRLKGVYQVQRQGILFAYGSDIQHAGSDELEEVSRYIGQAYDKMFSWYKHLMEKASLTNLIRPVHPEFYLSDYWNAAAQEELSFTATLLRIDSLLDFWKSRHPRRDHLAAILDIDPVDGPSWKRFLEKMLSISRERGCLGIKQLQAYFRTLDFENVPVSRVKFRGDLSEKEIKEFQDWLVHTLCEMANERKWPHQVHVGTHNHPLSNPLPLEKLGTRYPDQKLVLLHCWPYLEEAGFLAQAHPNVYVDTCWQPILNPDFLKRTMDTWLGYIPLNKWTMSNDSTSVEMAVGASMISRNVLGEALLGRQKQDGLSDEDTRAIASRILHENAEHVYEA